MSKKIKSIEELKQIGKDAEALVDLRKKWEGVDLQNVIQVKVGISSDTLEAKKLADEVGLTIVEMVKREKIENVVVYLSDFRGYEGDKPSLEIIVPNKGKVVFGNVDVKEAERVVFNYLKDITKLEEFMTNNDGNKSCNGNH